MSEIDNPWDLLPSSPPYVLPADSEIISNFNKRADDNCLVRLDALPEPYFGNKDAPVVLLGLNPGFDDNDPEVHAEPAFQLLLFDNYRHSPAEYPFYFLNPAFTNPGRDWWERKLKPLLGSVPREKLANSIFCVEYFPYHSRKFGHARLRLPSQPYSCALVKEAMRRQAFIVVMRAKTLWFSAVPELVAYKNIYTLNSPQNVTISPRNCIGFDEILNRVR